jgi:hypothetical protein
MPDHLHLLLTPAPNVSLEKAMQFIKGGFSFRLKSKLDVWSRSFNQTQILTSEKFEACKTYIEQNPVRAGLTTSPEAFHHSSKQHQQIIDLAPSHLRKIETNHNPIAPKLETKGLQPIRAKREPGRSRGLQAPEIKSQKKGL